MEMDRVKENPVEGQLEPETGPGVPGYFVPLLHPERVGGLDPRNKKFTKAQASSEFEKLATKLNLEQYKFGDEETTDNPDLELDVTALDRYNDEIRHYRKILVEECRAVPTKQNLDIDSLEPLAQAIARLCRCAYYGTYKAQNLAEGTVPLLIWVLSRKYFPESFLADVVKNMSEMFWSSSSLKEQLVNTLGVKTLVMTMKMLPLQKRLATWACYTLTMASTGCVNIIRAALKEPGIEELVAEFSFEMYWYDWPVNFGMVLQGIFYGPRSVSANEELYQFQ